MINQRQLTTEGKMLWIDSFVIGFFNVFHVHQSDDALFFNDSKLSRRCDTFFIVFIKFILLQTALFRAECIIRLLI